KLIFMGGEFAQGREWQHDYSLDWALTVHVSHSGVQKTLEELNRLYREVPALHELDFDPAGCEWIDGNDWEQSVLSFIRKGREPEDVVVAVFNFTPVPRHNYRLGVPKRGFWREIFNSDATVYWGSGQGNVGGVETTPVSWHGKHQS